MPKVIITGKNGFLSCALKEHLQGDTNFEALQISVKGNDWENLSFEGVDAIIHTAAIFNVSEKKVPYSEFERINVDLTRRIAQKAKAQNVGQFIFISSMASMTGTLPSLSKDLVLNSSSPMCPISKYGKSKLEAEQALSKIADKNFKVAIIRPPVIYGKNCKGNYVLLKKLALKLGIFPNLENKKSMIYVENLCELIKLILQNKSDGVFLPQNKELVSVKDMVAKIAETNGKKVFFSNLMALAIKPAAKISAKFSKAFGSLYYEESASNYFDGKYQIVDFDESIRRTEKL